MGTALYLNCLRMVYGEAHAMEIHVVQAGETLWNLAGQYGVASYSSTCCRR